jgi:hypothetical protein
MRFGDGNIDLISARISFGGTPGRTGVLEIPSQPNSLRLRQTLL